MYLVRGCALVGSLAIWTYSLTMLPFVIMIISVNGSESIGPVVQKCRSTWQDLSNRNACACCVMSNGSQDPFRNKMIGDYVHEGDYFNLRC